MDLRVLFIILGVILGLIVLLLIISFILVHLALFAKSAWCTDNKEWSPKVDDKQLMERIRKSIEYNRTHGEVITIKSNDGYTLSGKYYRVQNAKRTVICVHGYRGKAEGDFSIGSEWLREQNDCNYLLISNRGHYPSQGKYITMGILERNDIHLWVNKVMELTDTPIYLWGISMGASSVMMSLYKGYSDQVKGIAVDCGYTSPYRQFKKEIAHYVGPFIASIVLDFASIWIRLLIGINLKDGDTQKALANSNLPIIISHGLADKFVLPQNSVDNYNAAKGDKELILVEGATHGWAFVKDNGKIGQKIKEMFEKTSQN